jgi:hypothetical protein
MTILRTSHQQTLLHSEVTKLKAQALTRSDEHRGFVAIPTITVKVSAHFRGISTPATITLLKGYMPSSLNQTISVRSSTRDWISILRTISILTPASGLADDSTLFKLKKADRLP